MPNIHELRARRAKAEAIVAHVWAALTPEQRTDPETIEAFRLCESEGVRRLIAADAGQHPPSEETWRLVCSLIAQRVKDARWGREQGRKERSA